MAARSGWKPRRSGRFIPVASRPGRIITWKAGQYLRVPAEQGDGLLVFETDASGTVTRWRAGVAPQVDYIEGCA